MPEIHTDLATAVTVAVFLIGGSYIVGLFEGARIAKKVIREKLSKNPAPATEPPR